MQPLRRWLAGDQGDFPVQATNSEDRKLALEERRLNEDLLRRDREFEIRKREVSIAGRPPWWNVLTALLAAAGVIYGAIEQNNASIAVEKAKENALAVQAAKQFEAQVILQTLAVQDKVQKDLTFRFISDVGLIPDFSAKIDGYFSTHPGEKTSPHAPEAIPTVPSNTYGPPHYNFIGTPFPIPRMSPDRITDAQQFGMWCGPGHSMHRDDITITACKDYAAKHNLPDPPSN